MRNQPLAIHQKLVLLRLTAKNGMVLKHQRPSIPASLPLEEQSCGKPANSAADNRAVIRFAGVRDILRKGIVSVVANGVTIAQHWKSVAIGRAVLSDSSVTGELVRLRQ